MVTGWSRPCRDCSYVIISSSTAVTVQARHPRTRPPWYQIMIMQRDTCGRQIPKKWIHSTALLLCIISQQVVDWLWFLTYIYFQNQPTNVRGTWPVRTGSSGPPAQKRPKKKLKQISEISETKTQQRTNQRARHLPPTFKFNHLQRTFEEVRRKGKPRNQTPNPIPESNLTPKPYPI